MFQLVDDGRWSGGGSAWIANFREAMARHPELCAPPSAEDAYLVVPRNVVSVSLLRRRQRYLIVPQNAWPFGRPYGTSRELQRWVLLRLGSAVSVRCAASMLRISSAVPVPAGHRQSSSRVLHNVLDSDFEGSLETASSLHPGPVAECVVCVGPIVGYKNLGSLIRGYAAYVASGGQLRLLIRGEPWDRRYAERLRRCAVCVKGLVLDEKPATRAEVLALLGSSAGAIFPALVEASPVTLLEAVATGSRSAVSSITGHVELLQTVGASKDAVIFDPHSVSSVASAFRRLEDAQTTRSIIGSSDERADARAQWIMNVVRFLKALCV